MADKKISELDQVLQINNDAVFPMSQNSGGTPTTYKASITQIGAEIGEDQTFSNLQTTDKTLVGAINEVAQGGGGGGSSNANLAPDYDATSTYAVGDWCIYNGTLYQCNTAIAVAEAFDPTHWTAKKVVDAFADIEDELDDKVDTTDFYATNLPIESGSATNTKAYIDNNACYNSGDTITATISKYCSGRTVSAGDKVVLFYPLSKEVKTNSSRITITTTSNCWRADGQPIALTQGTYNGAVTDGGLYFIIDLSSSATGNRAVSVELVNRTIEFLNI